LIEFENVSFCYPEAPAAVLRDVSLEIPEGSFALVAGETGSGKSTLLRAVNGLVPHFTGGEFSGRVLIDGRSTAALAPRRLADVVAFVPQDPSASFVVDCVEDELAYAMENLGVAPSAMRRRVEEMLDLLDIERLRDRSVRTLSGGERQRVAIAAALTAGPRVMVLDEPTSQLDPQGAEDVLAALQRLVHDMGMTVVIAEHRLERVAGFVDIAIGCWAGHPPLVGDPRLVLESLRTGPPVTRLGWLAGWSPAPLTVREARRIASGVGPLRAPARPADGTGEMPLLTAHDVSASYGERTALAGVHVELRPGEIVALMGRNGAGKTTLLRCLAGVLQPRRGRIDFMGGAPRPGKDVALCPQEPEMVLFSDRVADEIAVTLRANARSESVEDVLREFRLLEFAARHPRDLSAGERLLVATAAIVATGATVLLLDEPTRGLDYGAKKHLAAFVRGFAESGRAVMLATHDVELAAELATRVVMLAGGEVIEAGHPSDVLGDSPVFAPQMARVFGREWLTPEQVAGALAS
jgi:energy-coupling factor transporter ATP-binding protein EcfA2